MTPAVSLVIACRNEARFIAACLDSVLASDYPASAVEIIVVDGMSTDATRAIVDDYAARDARIRRLDNPKRITPAGLNRGIAAARADIVLRLDAHTIYPPDYVRRCVAALEESGADCVGGVWITRVRDDGPYADAVRLTLTHPLGVGNAAYRLGVSEPRWVDAVPFGCFRREIFRRAGLYNEALERSQDLDLWARIRGAGGRILLHPGIRATYLARGRLGEVWRYNFGNGFWVTWPMRLVGTRFAARHLTPLAFVTTLAVTAIAGLLWRPLWALLAVLVAAYLGAIVGASVFAALRERRPALVLTGPVAFAALHMSYGLGSLWGLIRPIREVHRAQVTAARAALIFRDETPAG